MAGCSLSALWLGSAESRQFANSIFSNIAAQPQVRFRS